MNRVEKTIISIARPLLRFEDYLREQIGYKPYKKKSKKKNRKKK